jgi:hypothetical protein
MSASKPMANKNSANNSKRRVSIDKMSEGENVKTRLALPIIYKIEQ